MTVSSTARPDLNADELIGLHTGAELAWVAWNACARPAPPPRSACSIYLTSIGRSPCNLR